MVAFPRIDGRDLAAAPLLVVLAVTAGFGGQYLLWPVPLLIARGGRTVWRYLWPASLYAANGYLRLLTLPTEGHGDQVPQTGLCLLVCLGAVITLPWNARQLGSSRTRQERKMDPVGSGSVIGI